MTNYFKKLLISASVSMLAFSFLSINVFSQAGLAPIPKLQEKMETSSQYLVMIYLMFQGLMFTK